MEILLTAVGGFLLFLGVSAWTGRFRGWVRILFLGHGVVALAPFGFGLMVLGISLVIDAAIPLAIGMLLLGAGAILLVWQPPWMEPPWYREVAESLSLGAPTVVPVRQAFASGHETCPPEGHKESGLRVARAYELSSTAPPVVVGGFVQDFRRGTLHLLPDRLVFVQDASLNQARGEDYRLEILLSTVRSVVLSRRGLPIPGRGGSRAWGILKNLHVSTFRNGLHVFRVRSPHAWLGDITARREVA